LIGGLLVTRLGGGARDAAGLALLLGALTAGHLALIPADGSILTLGAVLLVAGAAIAPTEASVYAMVDRAAPAPGMTESFAWLGAAMAVGDAIGAAGAGVVADLAGPAAAFMLAGGAGALAVLTARLRSRTITARAGAPSRRFRVAPRSRLRRDVVPHRADVIPAGRAGAVRRSAPG
jgi:predicted MFS family arabinose efflux permease